MNLLLRCYPGNVVIEFVGRLVLEVSVVIGLAGLLSFFVLRRRPAARNALWLGVLVCVAVSPLLLVSVEKAGWIWSVRRPDVLREDPMMERLHRISELKGNRPKTEVRSNNPSPATVPASDVEVASQVEPAFDLSAVAMESPGWTSTEMWQMAASTGMLVWLAGVVFLSIRLWHGHRQIRRLISDVQPIHDNRLDVPLQIVAATFDVQSIPCIVRSPSVAGPVVVGLIQSIVVLNDDFVETASAAQLTDVLVHECAHVLRRDTWIGLFQRLVQLAFWPHPLIYVMNRSLSRACEEVCDNYVLRGGDAVTYAQTLLQLAERYHPVPTPAAALAMFSRRWKLQDRVAGLLDPQRDHNTRVGVGKFAAIIGLLIVGGAVLAAGRFKDEEKTKEPDKAAAATADEHPQAESESGLEWRVAAARTVQALREPSEVLFEDVPLSEAMAYMCDLHKLEIRLDEDAFRELNIPVTTQFTLNLEEPRLRSLLKLVLEPLSLDIMIEKGELVITTHAKAAASLNKFRYDADQLYHQNQPDIPDLSDALRAGITLEDLVEAIPQVIDPSSWQKNGGSGTLGLGLHPHPDRKGERSLFVHQRLDVAGKIDDLLWRLEEAVRDPRVVADEQGVETKEYSITNLHSLGLSDDVILENMHRQSLTGKTPEEQLRETVKIDGDRMLLTQQVWIHQSVARQFKRINAYIERNHDRDWDMARMNIESIGSHPERSPRLLRGVQAPLISFDDINGPLEKVLELIQKQTNTQVHIAAPLQKRADVLGSLVNQKSGKRTLPSLLDSILEPFDLDWYLLDPDIIVVTTKTDAAAHLEVRAYRTKELLAAGESTVGLMTRISAISPDRWAAQGGPGLMASLPGVLIVNQTRRVHDQIGRLFFDLNSRNHPHREK